MSPSQVSSIICATAEKHPQKSARKGCFTSAQTSPKASSTERPENPEVPSVTNLCPVSTGLLEIRPQTTHITKICSLESLEAADRHQVKSVPGWFPRFHSGQAAQGRVGVKPRVIKFTTNCSLFSLQLKET